MQPLILFDFYIHLVLLQLSKKGMLLLNTHRLLLPSFLLNIPSLLSSSVYRTLYHAHALSHAFSPMHLHAYVLPVSFYTLSSVSCFI